MERGYIWMDHGVAPYIGRLEKNLTAWNMKGPGLTTLDQTVNSATASNPAHPKDLGDLRRHKCGRETEFLNSRIAKFRLLRGE